VCRAGGVVGPSLVVCAKSALSRWRRAARSADRAQAVAGVAKPGVRDKGVVASVKEAIDYEVWAMAAEDAAFYTNRYWLTSYWLTGKTWMTHLMLPARSTFPPSAAARACPSAVGQRPAGAPVMRRRLPELLARGLEVLSRGTPVFEDYDNVNTSLYPEMTPETIETPLAAARAAPLRGRWRGARGLQRKDGVVRAQGSAPHVRLRFKAKRATSNGSTSNHLQTPTR
jgi:hypothetical protein